MSGSYYEKHLRKFYSDEFKVQPENKETYLAIVALLHEENVVEEVLKAAEIKKTKNETGDNYPPLTTCDESYQIMLKYFMKKGSKRYIKQDSVIKEMGELMKSPSMARYVYNKNKANVEATAKTLKALFDL